MSMMIRRIGTGRLTKSGVISSLLSRAGNFANDFLHGGSIRHQLHSTAAINPYPSQVNYSETAWEGIVGAIDAAQDPEGKYGELEKYSNDLTELARRGKLDPVIGRDDEIRQCIHSLCRSRKNNPVIIGEPGVGKTAIAQGLAQRIVSGDVPEPLKNLKLISLDMGLYPEDFEDRLQDVLMEVIASNGQTVFFVDQIHTLLGGAAIDLLDESAAKLKMELTFKPIKLEEINRGVLKLDMEKLILKNDTEKASEERLAKVESDLERLIEKQKRFKEQWELEKLVRSIKEKIDRVNQDAEGTLINLQCHLEEAERNLSEYCQQSGKSCMLLREKVTDIDIAEVVSKWTGIPLSNLQESEREKLVSLEHALLKRVVGQDMAVKVVADAIRRSKVGVGLSDPNRPIASFMFMGPNGVAKTELAKALASYLFNTKNALVRIDMSQYMDKHAVSRLVGGLAETVTRMPYSVVLFDEMEKANHDVFNILLQLLDDGRITDSQGRRTVDFTKSIIIMTSNFIPQMHYDTKDTVYYDLVELARLTFWPQLIDHIHEHVVFHPFEIRDIVENQLNCIKDRLKQKKIDLRYTKEATNILGELGNFGAKPVKEVIQQVVENEISLGILQGDFNQDDTLIVDSCPSAKLGVHIRKVDSHSGIKGM